MKKNEKKAFKRRQLINRIFIFIPALFFFAFITTVQFFILGNYLDYKNITKVHITMIILFWLLCSFVFTYVTYRQINQWYDKPMKAFAKATNRVANGDFSVYVEPLHSADKMDYLDYMFLDFNKMVDELGSIETLKTDFISNVSHEIKTPIAVIQNYAEYLQKGNITENQRIEYAKTIEDTSKRLANLITNILKLNKLENQRIKPEVQRYDICRQLSECALQFEKIWENKNIEFEADLEDRAIIYADKSLMELVWNNLISNALKFTQSGGKVTLKQTSTEDSIIVAVCDTGCGMSENTIKHIFDKFYQGDSSHSKEGNGLGLALTLRILELHDSTIDVISMPDQGTTFKATIPVIISEYMKEESDDGSYIYE
ncbi:HAMP domain-containing sensor histidine kinase [Lacrimispora sp. 38-1]|uniref:HAMP domain-containing sensor histidine kinase n=1 Tax=Lacrimispora sp. 38-1 TaxID=3125778 RepID=UPI003CF93D5B